MLGTGKYPPLQAASDREESRLLPIARWAGQEPRSSVINQIVGSASEASGMPSNSAVDR